MCESPATTTTTLPGPIPPQRIGRNVSTWIRYVFGGTNYTVSFYCLKCYRYLKKNLNASQSVKYKLQRRLSGCAASPFTNKVIKNDSKRFLVVFIGGSHEDDIYDSAK